MIYFRIEKPNNVNLCIELQRTIKNLPAVEVYEYSGKDISFGIDGAIDKAQLSTLLIDIINRNCTTRYGWRDESPIVTFYPVPMVADAAPTEPVWITPIYAGQITATPAAQPPATPTNEITVGPAPAASVIFNINEPRVVDAEIERTLYAHIASNGIARTTELDKLLAEYAALMNKMTLTLRIINELSSDVKNNAEVKSVIDQLRNISRSDKINDVYVTSKEIVVVTNAIHANDKNNVKRDLGKIRIVIPIRSLYGNNPAVHFFPVDRCICRDGRPIYLVPHVRGDETFCYGNATQMFIEALAAKDVEMVVDIAIRFLENPNLEDCLGKQVCLWPEVASV